MYQWEQTDNFYLEGGMDSGLRCKGPGAMGLCWSMFQSRL